MLWPIRTKNPPDEVPVATIALIVANVAVFLLATGTGNALDPDTLNLYGSSAENFSLLTVFTSLFLHADRGA